MCGMAKFIIHQQWEMGIALGEERAGEVGLGERGLTVNQQIRFMPNGSVALGRKIMFGLRRASFFIFLITS